MVTLATSSRFGSGGVAQIASACGPGNGVIVSATRWWCDGTLGRNVLTGPGFANVDFGLHKKFRVTEHSNLQLQANAFNLFNHPNFNNPSAVFGTGTFGFITSTSTENRDVQFGLKLAF